MIVVGKIKLSVIILQIGFDFITQGKKENRYTLGVSDYFQGNLRVLNTTLALYVFIITSCLIDLVASSEYFTEASILTTLV